MSPATRNRRSSPLHRYPLPPARRGYLLSSFSSRHANAAARSAAPACLLNPTFSWGKNSPVLIAHKIPVLNATRQAIIFNLTAHRWNAQNVARLPDSIGSFLVIGRQAPFLELAFPTKATEAILCELRGFWPLPDGVISGGNDKPLR